MIKKAELVARVEELERELARYKKIVDNSAFENERKCRAILERMGLESKAVESVLKGRSELIRERITHPDTGEVYRIYLHNISLGMVGNEAIILLDGKPYKEFLEHLISEKEFEELIAIDPRIERIYNDNLYLLAMYFRTGRL